MSGGQEIKEGLLTRAHENGEVSLEVPLGDGTAILCHFTPETARGVADQLNHAANMAEAAAAGEAVQGARRS